MTRPHHHSRTRRSAIAAGAALAVIAGVAGAAPFAGAATPAGPELSLIAASNSVIIDRYEDEPGVYLDLGTYVTAEGGPLEFRVTRASYKDPVVAKQIIRKGKKTTTKTLPKGLVKDFSGLPGFLQVTVTDAAGAAVVKTTETFCPNNASGRIRPDAPSTSKYPESCSTNPFTLGSVWGVENGWATNTNLGYYSEPVDLAPGEYTAKVSVAKKYRDLFGMAGTSKSIKVTVRERKWDEGGGVGAAPSGARAAGHAGHGGGHGGHGAPAGHSGASAHVSSNGRGADAPAPPALPNALMSGKAAAHLGDGPGHTDGSRIAPALKPNAKRPTGRASVPDVPKPDLRALPAWDISITDGEDGDIPGKDYLAFSANVWNAGPAPLVVDGFRGPGKDLMDAYQYFHDAKGKQVGYAPAGTMEWDARQGHEHWHFTDFASYRLLRADKKEAVRSGKEAFCLANTDAIDYTVKNANWHPNNTDLSTACGVQSSVSVREVLDVGSGDTYTQYRPGQSFDITDLPNGTYYIEVLANPERRLHETSLSNNTALRKVVLSGKPGARKVTVPAHDLINAP
ncbi:lysyl oxidase family protein [Streptomyces sp. 35G-GA-8]|uniref:lysyl oxidase family protein n=1 Tax=Streptomyces sp. 35G-GA-8 TaxID=2939434 RepID=UPI00201EFA90|nr:lysyl oxidase family protein [Streptomyces sp. 35G-GA-8]MCL7381729.1 lysyl oxidase family protein [Streptomyces sp. 35G-GA-8]